MKSLRIFIFVLLLAFVGWVAMPKKTDKCSSGAEARYVTPAGEVTDAIVNLLGLTGIRIEGASLKAEENWSEPKVYLKSRRLEDVVPAVQGKLNPSITWFGSPNKERWEKDPKKPKLLAPQAVKIIDICFGPLQQGEKSYPQKTPKAILFLGATLSRVRMRLAYLNELYDMKKLPPNLPVYIMTGERKLDEAVGETQGKLMDPGNGILPFRKDWAVPQEPVTDEGEMVKLVFSQSRHRDLDERNIIPVYVTKGEGRRATTESTVIQWLKECSPSAGSYLAISNQPYNFYQESVIRRVLIQAGRPDICVDVVGPGIEEEAENNETTIEQATNLLNNTSRILYELLEIRKNLKR